MSRDSVCEVHDSTPVRARRFPRVRAVAALSVAAALTLAACGGAAPEVTDNVSPSPSASPSPVPSASPSPEVVVSSPDNPIAEVPWDDVGDGWFLVDHRVRRTFPWGSEEESMKSLGESEGTMLLLSPKGDWYSAHGYDGTGSAYVLGWRGENVWLATQGAGRVEFLVVGVKALNMKTGDASTSGLEVLDSGIPFVITSEDTSMVFYYTGDGMAVEVEDLTAGGQQICHYVYQELEASYVRLANGNVKLVCLAYRKDGKTDVNLFTVGSTVKKETLDTFVHPSARYQILGWLDEKRFVLARRTDDFGEQISATFVYDVSTQEIADYPLPDVSAHYGVLLAGGTRILEGKTTLSTAAGEFLVDVPMTCDEDEPHNYLAAASGERLLVSCYDGSGAALIDVESGAVLGEWSFPAGTDIKIFGS